MFLRDILFNLYFCEVFLKATTLGLCYILNQASWLLRTNVRMKKN